MKKLFPVLCLAGTMMFGACGTGDETATTTDDTTTAVVTAPVELPSLISVQHKVKDYATWKSEYEMNDSARIAAGLHKYLITRGIEDTNTVMVVMRMDDTAEAKQMVNDPFLKTAMKKAGVISAPVINMVHVDWMDTTTNSNPVRVLVTHKVKDRSEWKKAFDANKQMRNDAGLMERLIAYSIDDPNTVSVAFVITDAEKAKAFMASKELQDHMAKAGVVGKPDVFMYTVSHTY